MTVRQGQATVEWLAVLIATAFVAGGIAVGMRGLGDRVSSTVASLDAIASAGTFAARRAELPGGMPGKLPIVAGGSIVSIAAQLAAAGIAEVPPGSNRGPGIDVFTDGNAEAWCADFVSWVLRAAGRPFSGGLSSGWRIAWTGDVRSWFMERSAYRDRLSADPQPGDVVWFEHGHVGIVERVRGDDLLTIEGNAGDAVTRRTYARWRLNGDIGGFGRPGLND